MKKLIFTLTIFPLFGALQAAEKQKSTNPHLVFLADHRPILLEMDIQINGKSTSKAWDDFVGFLFKMLDSNKNGKLEKKEAAKVPDPGMVFQNRTVVWYGFEGARPQKGLDSNQDGTVNRQELSDYFRRHGASPFSIRFSAAAPGTALFADSGLIVPGGGSSPEKLNKTIYQLLDSNKDGELSKKEIQKFESRFMRRDADDDEMITTSEILGQPGRTGGSGQLLFLSSGVMPTAPAKDLPVMEVSLSLIHV